MIIMNSIFVIDRNDGTLWVMGGNPCGKNVTSFSLLPIS